MNETPKFPTAGDNFRTIGSLALDLVKEAARKRANANGPTETANNEDSRDGSRQR